MILEPLSSDLSIGQRVPRGQREEAKINITRNAKQRHLFKTGEFLTRARISRQTLYTYLTMGLINEAERTKTGRHLFDENTVKRVEIIQRLNTSGYPLRAIKEIYFKEGR